MQRGNYEQDISMGRRYREMAKVEGPRNGESRGASREIVRDEGRPERLRKSRSREMVPVEARYGRQRE